MLKSCDKVCFYFGMEILSQTWKVHEETCLFTKADIKIKIKQVSPRKIKQAVLSFDKLYKNNFCDTKVRLALVTG